MIHVYHAFSRTCLYDSVYLMDSLLTNKIGNSVVIYEKFIRRYKPSGNPRNEALGENTCQTSGNLDSYLVLLSGRKGINDAVYGLSGIVCVKSGKDKMSSLCRSNSC